MAGKLKDVLFILILGSISTFLLLGIKGYTYPKISRYEELEFKTAILDAAGLKYTQDDCEEIFSKNIREKENKNFEYYLSPNNSYIFEFEGRGLWGPIRGVITLNRDFETIESMRIISQEETPGLGARIAEESFLSQFFKKRVSPKLNVVCRRKSELDNEIDAISGATMTSQALIDMINESVKNFRALMEG